MLSTLEPDTAISRITLYKRNIRCLGGMGLGTAEKEFKKALEIDPDHPFAFIQLEEAYYFNGSYLKAIETLWTIYTNYFHIRPLEKIMEEYQNNGYSSALKLLLSDVEKSLQEGAFFPPAYLASLFLRISNITKALDYFEKGYEIHDQNLPYLKLFGKMYPAFKNEPRYIALLKKMNLPVE